MYINMHPAKAYKTICCQVPLLPALWRQRQISRSLRLAWSAYQVLCQPELQSEILSGKTKQNKRKYTSDRLSFKAQNSEQTP